MDACTAARSSVRWVAIRHGDDHIHLVAMLARQDGRRVRLDFERLRVRDACLAAEQRYGLRRTALVCTAAAGAGSDEEFFARLAQAGVQARKRFSTRDPGQVTGYAVALPGDTTKDGGPGWYGAAGSPPT